MERNCSAETFKKILVANLTVISMVVLVILVLMGVVFLDVSIDGIQKVLFIGALFPALFVWICMGVFEVDKYKRDKSDIERRNIEYIELEE